MLGIRLDYDSPLPSAAGGVAELEPLEPSATAAAFRDLGALAYRHVGDLGGFLPARVAAFALTSGGRDIVGGRFRPQMPLFAQAAGGGIRSYTFTGGRATPPATTPPENGRLPVPGLGRPTPPPPAPGGAVPPPNQGFGGRPGGTPPPGGGSGGSPGTTTRQKPPPPPPPTTTTTTTTAPTTTTATTTTTAPPPPTTTTTTATTTTATTTTTAPPQTFGCGTGGIAVESDLPGCRIAAVNMAPGDSTFEHIRVTNTSGSTYTLALRATGTQNQLWQDLQMGVWEQATAPPSPLPPLLFWTTQFNHIATLAAGQSISLVVELYLPTSAGNADQNLAASIDLTWHATG